MWLKHTNQILDLLYIQQLALLPIKFHPSFSFEVFQYANISFLTKPKAFFDTKLSFIVQFLSLAYFSTVKLKFRCDSMLNKKIKQGEKL